MQGKKRVGLWGLLVVVGLALSAALYGVERQKSQVVEGSHLFKVDARDLWSTVADRSDEPLILSIRFDNSLVFALSSVSLTYEGDTPIYIINHSRDGYGYQIRYEDVLRIEGDTLIIGVENDIEKYYESIKHPQHNQAHVGVGLGSDGRLFLERKSSAIEPRLQEMQHQIYLDFFRGNTYPAFGPSLEYFEPNKPQSYVLAAVPGLFSDFGVPLTQEQRDAFNTVKYMRMNFFYLEESEELINGGYLSSDGKTLEIFGVEEYFSLLKKHAKFASITFPVALIDASLDDEDEILSEDYRWFSYGSFSAERNMISDYMQVYATIMEENEVGSHTYQEAQKKLEELEMIIDLLITITDTLWVHRMRLNPQPALTVSTMPKIKTIRREVSLYHNRYSREGE